MTYVHMSVPLIDIGSADTSITSRDVTQALFAYIRISRRKKTNIHIHMHSKWFHGAHNITDVLCIRIYKHINTKCRRVMRVCFRAVVAMLFLTLTPKHTTRMMIPFSNYEN